MEWIHYVGREAYAMKKLVKSALEWVVVLGAATAAAQVMPPHPMGGGMMGGPPPGMGNWNGNGGNGNNDSAATTITAESLAPAEMARIMDSLKEKYPEEFKKISELRKTNRRAAMEELRTLAAKENLKFPGVDQNAAGNANGHAAKPATDFTPRRNALREIRAAERRVAKAFPEEYERLQTLRKVNRHEFRKRFRELYLQLPPEPENAPENAPAAENTPAETKRPSAADPNHHFHEDGQK